MSFWAFGDVVWGVMGSECTLRHLEEKNKSTCALHAKDLMPWVLLWCQNRRAGNLGNVTGMICDSVDIQCLHSLLQVQSGVICRQLYSITFGITLLSQSHGIIGPQVAVRVSGFPLGFIFLPVRCLIISLEKCETYRSRLNNSLCCIHRYNVHLGWRMNDSDLKSVWLFTEQ